MHVSSTPENSNIKIEKSKLEYEIECPRCNDLMTLCSDFDQLYYLCDSCNFCLYAFKRYHGTA